MMLKLSHTSFLKFLMYYFSNISYWLFTNEGVFMFTFTYMYAYLYSSVHIYFIHNCLLLALL